MQYSLINFKPTQSYARIIDPKGTPRYVCFSDRGVAEKCLTELCTYRSKYGSWPKVDFTSEITTVKVKKTKRRSLQELLNYFDIEEYPDERLQEMSKSYNAQFFYCHDISFGTKGNTSSSLQVRGQDLYIPEDITLFTGQLEMNYKLR